jgi:hypothetical protein
MAFAALEKQRAHVAARDAHHLAIATRQRFACHAGVVLEGFAGKRVDCRKARPARFPARVIELLEALGAERLLNGIEPGRGKAQAVALGAEHNGCVALVDAKWDVGAVEGAREEEGRDAGAGDEDGLRHGGRGGVEIWREGNRSRDIIFILGAVARVLKLSWMTAVASDVTWGSDGERSELGSLLNKQRIAC